MNDKYVRGISRRDWLRSAVVTTASAAGPAMMSPPAPAATPQRVRATVGHVNPSVAESSWLFASKALVMPWEHGGGDWFDANGKLNGPAPLRQAIATAVTTIDIGGIDGDLLLRRSSNFEAPTIDGQVATGFWLHPSSNRAIELPTHYLVDDSLAIILNPRRGKLLRLLCLQPGQGLQVFKVRPPPIADLPMRVVPDVLPPDMGTLDDLSRESVIGVMGQGNYAKPWAYDATTGKDAEHGNMPYLRCAITPANQRGIAWFWWHKPVDEIYLRYCLWLEDDIALGMTELGVKLPGPEGDEASWRLIQGRPDPANPGFYAAYDYRYSADTPPADYGIASGSYNGAMLRTKRWYVFELHAKGNTFSGAAPNADGMAEVWINGNPVFTTGKVMWNKKPTSRFTKFFINIYHGGMGFPKRDIHYRLAKLARSTTRIGIPPELLVT